MKIALRVIEVFAACLAAIWATSWAFGLVSAPSTSQVFEGIAILAVVLFAIVAIASAGVKWLARAAKPFLLLALALVATGCATTINPGYAGIVVDYYGKDRGVQGYTVTTGRVWYNPWTTKVLEYPTFVQSVVWTHTAEDSDPSHKEGRVENEEITFTNADQMQIAADVSLAYHIDLAKVPAFYMKFRSEDLHQFTYNYLHSLARDKFNQVGGKYSIAQIMGDNGPFLAEVKTSLQKELDPIGVQLESQFGFIGAPRPPKGVIDSINMKVQATQVAIQKQNELVQVQADAAKEVARAEGHARAVLTTAEAESKANRMLADSLSGNLIALKQLEKWNGTLPQVQSGTGGLILSLPSR